MVADVAIGDLGRLFARSLETGAHAAEHGDLRRVFMISTAERGKEKFLFLGRVFALVLNSRIAKLHFLSIL
jgi:hypothetical protein